MTLNTAVKNWLATNAGTGTCFTSSGKSYTDADGVSHTGSTYDILNAFYVAHQVLKDSIIIIANTNYTQLQTTNGGADIDMSDLVWVHDNGGAVGTPYCVPSSTKGILNVVSTPGGAKIYLNGVDSLQTTPAVISEINAGSIAVALSLSGYNDVIDTIIIVAGQTTYESYTMSPVACISTGYSCEIDAITGQYNGWEKDNCGNRRMNAANCSPVTNGTLNITTVPIRAYIVLDGQDTKNVTPAILSVTPGHHTLQYILSGYQDLVKDIEIHQGETLIMVDTLSSTTQESGIGGALVVAATVGGILFGLFRK